MRINEILERARAAAARGVAVRRGRFGLTIDVNGRAQPDGRGCCGLALAAIGLELPDSDVARALRLDGVESTNFMCGFDLKGGDSSDAYRAGAALGVELNADPPHTDAEKAELIRKWKAEAQAEREAHPEAVERARIDDLYARAEARLDNTSSHFRLRARADAALGMWREKYPEAAAEEDRQGRIAQAEALEALAAAALHYDNAQDRQARHDELMARAAAIRAAN